MELITREQIRIEKRGDIFDSFDFLSTQATYFGRIQEGERIASFIEKHYWGGFFRSLTFTSAPNQDADFTNRLPAFVKSSLPQIDFISQPFSTAIFPCIPPGAIGIPFGTYCVDLRQNADAIFRKIHSKHRNVIRSAEKKGVLIKCGVEYLETAYQVISNVYKRQGLEFYSIESLKKLSQALTDRLQIWVALFEDNIQAAAFLVAEKNRAFYLYGGTIESSVTGSMNLLHWKAICTLQQQGLQAYDFLGARINVDPESKFAGIQKFKERFGGEFQQGAIWKYPIRKWKFFLFYTLMKVRNLMKEGLFKGDTIDQEIRKWR